MTTGRPVASKSSPCVAHMKENHATYATPSAERTATDKFPAVLFRFIAAYTERNPHYPKQKDGSYTPVVFVPLRGWCAEATLAPSGAPMRYAAAPAAD